MNITNYLKYVPEIEKEIVDRKLDSLVVGMGPTAWLLRYVNRKVLNDLRLWGCHDGCRIMPMDDIVVMDQPTNALHPDSGRHRHLVDGRPKRLWIYKKNAPPWKPHLPKSLAEVTTEVDFAVWPPPRTPINAPFKLDSPKIHTLAISPTGMTTLAWREGCRRIGVIGADMNKNHHHTFKWHKVCDAFFVKCAARAHVLGGLICNLSPISSLEGFRKWQPPSESSSDQTSSSKEPEQSESSKAPSDGTAPDQSKSSSCEPTRQDGTSAQPGNKASGA